jgi:hypothetical protein
MGPVVGRPAAPPLECRGLPQDRCDGPGAVELQEPEQVARVIVSCEGAPCTATDGAFRIDILDVNGMLWQVGRGTYGNGVQPSYPPAE